MRNIKCYLYSDFPGRYKHWVLGVIATSRQDAREYLRIYHAGYGKPIGVIEGNQGLGEHTMACGAITEKAQAVMNRKR